MDNLKNKEFDDITEALKERVFPFLFVERNANGVDYQVYVPDTAEFELEDMENLKDGALKVLEILNNAIDKTSEEA